MGFPLADPPLSEFKEMLPSGYLPSGLRVFPVGDVRVPLIAFAPVLGERPLAEGDDPEVGIQRPDPRNERAQPGRGSPRREVRKRQLHRLRIPDPGILQGENGRQGIRVFGRTSTGLYFLTRC